MSLIIEGICLIGLGGVLIVQTVRGKINWGQILDKISNKNAKVGDGSAAQSNQAWLEQQDRQHRAFLDDLNRMNNQSVHQRRVENNNRYARTGSHY